MGALAAAKRKAHVVADVVAHAQTDFAAKPMANAPALARSDAAAEPKAHVVADLVAIARTNLSAKPMADAPAVVGAVASADAGALASSVVAADAGALAPALARADGGPVEQTNAKTHALADGDARRPHGGARIFADAAAFFTAEFEADKGSDACTEPPADAAADAPPDPESLSGAVE